MISKLGDDLLVEILIRLPNPRFTCRCKPVSKQWSSVISDPSFNRRFVSHHQRPDNPPLLLPSDDPQSILRSILPMPSGVDGLCFAVLDSFKDLLLCGFEFPQELAELDRLYFVCNLFTKQWLALPLSPVQPQPGLVARLVCEPVISNELDLGLGLGDHHDQVSSVCYSEYRFRVVLIYGSKSYTKVEVFCSETGEWTKDALVLDDHIRMGNKNVVSYNGEVFWPYWYKGVDGITYRVIAAFNPFHLDIPPDCIHVPAALAKPRWDFGVSQGALHVIVFEEKPVPGCSRVPLSVWRMQENRTTWRKICGGVLKTTPRCLHHWGEKADTESEPKHFPEENTSKSNYEVNNVGCPYLHPGKPEIIFFHYLASCEGYILSCDLRKGELEFFCKLRVVYRPRWEAFLLRASCWPTPIPRYEKLRGLYNGSYGCWVQSDEPTTLLVTRPTTPPITEKRVGVEHSGHWRKDNRSPSPPRRLCYDAEMGGRLVSVLFK